jgi:hypothetical protein
VEYVRLGAMAGVAVLAIGAIIVASLSRRASPAVTMEEGT